jgi:hypothetical protein
MGAVDEDDEDIRPHIQAMRSACRCFHTEVDEFVFRRQGAYPSWRFYDALGKLRAVVGLHVALLSTKFGIDIEHELAAIIPPDPGNESDDEEEPPWVP